jgi:hypothetical protein
MENDTFLQFYKPAVMPAPILNLQEALIHASGEPVARQAALAIVQEYYGFFGCTGMRQDMWLLLSSAMSNNNTSCLATAGERYNLLFFYEFTLVLMDAVYVLHGEERLGKLV